MKTYLIDVDGVLANMVEPWLEVLYKVTHRSYFYDQVKDFDFTSIASATEASKVWAHIAKTPGWCANLAPYPGTSALLHRLRMLGRVVAVTAPLAQSDFWTFERRRWLRAKGFHDRDIVFAHDKGLVHGDALIDDGEHNIRDFRGPGYLVARPWNRGTMTLEQIVEALGG